MVMPGPCEEGVHLYEDGACVDCGATSLLTLPTERPDLHRFGENIAWFSWMLRLQIIFSLATDEKFAEQTAGAYSATARLKAIATTCNATTLEVS